MILVTITEISGRATWYDIHASPRLQIMVTKLKQGNVPSSLTLGWCSLSQDIWLKKVNLLSTRLIRTSEDWYISTWKNIHELQLTAISEIFLPGPRFFVIVETLVEAGKTEVAGVAWACNWQIRRVQVGALKSTVLHWACLVQNSNFPGWYVYLYPRRQVKTKLDALEPELNLTGRHAVVSVTRVRRFTLGFCSQAYYAIMPAGWMIYRWCVIAGNLEAKGVTDGMPLQPRLICKYCPCPPKPQIHPEDHQT